MRSGDVKVQVHIHVHRGVPEISRGSSRGGHGVAEDVAWVAHEGGSHVVLCGISKVRLAERLIILHVELGGELSLSLASRRWRRYHLGWLLLLGDGSPPSLFGPPTSRGSGTQRDIRLGVKAFGERRGIWRRRQAPRRVDGRQR